MIRCPSIICAMLACVAFVIELLAKHPVSCFLLAASIMMLARVGEKKDL